MGDHIVLLDRKLNPQEINAWGRIGMNGPPVTRGPVLKEMTKQKEPPQPRIQKPKLPEDIALSILRSIEENILKESDDEVSKCVLRIIDKRIESYFESKTRQEPQPSPKIESTYDSWQPHFFSYMSDQESDGNFCYYEKSSGFDIEVNLKEIWYTPIVLFPFGTGNEKLIELPDSLKFNYSDSGGVTGEINAMKGTDEDSHPCLIFPDTVDWKSMKLPIKFSTYP